MYRVRGLWMSLSVPYSGYRKTGHAKDTSIVRVSERDQDLDFWAEYTWKQFVRYRIIRHV